MLKSAFNAITSIHSRQATLKRLGTPDIYSPIRITPSNYFRFLRGPEYTTVQGVEYIIPIDSIKGQYAQKISFDAVPDLGSFKLRFSGNNTTDLPYNVSAAAMQTALRLLAGLGSVTVAGNFTSGFIVTHVGSSTTPSSFSVVDNTLTDDLEAVNVSFTNTYTSWAKTITKGDKIIDGSMQWTVDEIIHMHDLGASLLGYRVRAD